jgi:hypothetical protein
MMKPAIAFALGVIITISTLVCMGFTSSAGSNQEGQILISNDGGGAYFYNGKKLYLISGTSASYVPVPEK